MVHLYKAHIFHAFTLQPGTFDRLPAETSTNGKDVRIGDWYVTSPQITPNKATTFAEYSYFHPHVRELLFSREGALRVFRVDPTLIRGWRMGLSFRRQGGSVTRLLCLKGVNVMLYDLDIGILSIEVEYDRICNSGGKQGLDFSDVLDINNIIRRSAPSYLVLDRKESYSEKQKSDSNLADRIWYQPDGNLPESLEGCIGFEDFGDRFDASISGNTDGSKVKSNHYLSRHFDCWLKKFRKDMHWTDDTIGHPILDERNFLTTFVMADSIDTGRRKDSSHRNIAEHGNCFGTLEAESDRFRNILYQYVFVDPSSDAYIKNPTLRDALLTDVLYLRFRDYGTYYGFTRYGGAYLMHGNDDFSRDVLSSHFDSMYFQIANLLLLFRAALLELSRKSADISMGIHETTSFWERSVEKKVSQLRSDFLRFQNRYWFTEVTAQEQGIEIFDLWSRRMENVRLFEEVEKEISALHEFGMSMINRRLGDLTYINVSALVLAVIAIIVNAFDFNIHYDFGRDVIGVWLVIGLFSAFGSGIGWISYLLAKRVFEKGKDPFRRRINSGAKLPGAGNEVKK